MVANITNALALAHYAEAFEFASGGRDTAAYCGGVSAATEYLGLLRLLSTSSLRETMGPAMSLPNRSRRWNGEVGDRRDRVENGGVAPQPLVFSLLSLSWSFS